MRPTISLLNFQIYWMTVLYPERVISGFTFGVRYKYYSCSKAYKVMKVHRQVYQAFIWEDRMYEDCKHQHVDFKPIILIYTFTRLCSLQAYISWFHNGFFFFVAHLFCLVSFQKKIYFAWSTLITSKKKRHIWCRRSAFRVAGVFTSSFVLNLLNKYTYSPRTCLEVSSRSLSSQNASLNI